jgi:hypothetical protein
LEYALWLQDIWIRNKDHIKRFSIKTTWADLLF